jgi:hypothetical protein
VGSSRLIAPVVGAQLSLTLKRSISCGLCMPMRWLPLGATDEGGNVSAPR